MWIKWKRCPYCESEKIWEIHCRVKNFWLFFLKEKKIKWKTFGGRYSTLHIIANGTIPADAMKIQNDSDKMGIHVNDDKS